MRTVRLGGGSAMWGDALDPSMDLAASGEVDFLCFDFLAELTMSLLHRAKARNPDAGYAPDIVGWLEQLLPVTKNENIRIVTNAGGANPRAAGSAVAERIGGMGLKGTKIATVTGDDFSNKLDELASEGWRYENMDTGESGIDRIRDRIVAADVYIGSESIIAGLDQEADVVLAGRCSDNSLFVGPVMHQMQWKFDAEHEDRIAAAITLGHLIECSCCVTGGMSSQWERVDDPASIGYPIGSIDEDARISISKLKGTGGLVDPWTVKEHLVYEVQDPRRYTMPDGVADFTSVTLSEGGENRVEITGATGAGRPDTLKLAIGYDDGWIAEGLVLFPWPKAFERAQYAERRVRGRLEKLGIPIDELQISFMGVNTLGGCTVGEPSHDLDEVGLRVAARTRTKEAADAVRREVSLLWITGPVGTAFGVPFRPRRVISLWPTLVPRSAVQTSVEIKET